MALSGSANYTVPAGTIISDALGELGVLAAWESMSSEQSELGLRYLNYLIKDWSLQKVQIWTRHNGVLLLSAGTDTYTFPDISLSGGDDGIVNESDLVVTTSTADTAAAATSITVDSNTGIAANYKLFIVLSDGTRHDTTVTSVSGSTIVNFADALPDDATSGDRVFCYNNNVTLFSPRDIQDVRIRDKSNIDIMLTCLSRTDYAMINDKTINASPNQYFINKERLSQSITLAPVPTDSNEYLIYTYTKYLDDVDSLTEDVEFPLGWAMPLVTNLAVRLSTRFGRENALGTVGDPNSLGSRARESFIVAAGFSRDDEDIQLNPSRKSY